MYDSVRSADACASSLASLRSARSSARSSKRSPGRRIRKTAPTKRDNNPSPARSCTSPVGTAPGTESLAGIPMSDHDILISLLATKSARRGNFVLSSGRASTLYIDARLTTMSAEGLALIGPLDLSLFRQTLANDSVY